MTPLNPHETQRPGNTGFVTGLTFGIVAGFVITCLGSGAAYLYVKREGERVRRGWNLVPVVVAAVDIPENTTVTFDMISQRSIPEQFVTSSVVKPDRASSIVNQKVMVPLQAGDPLYWSNFKAGGAR